MYRVSGAPIIICSRGVTDLPELNAFTNSCKPAAGDCSASGIRIDTFDSFNTTTRIHAICSPSPCACRRVSFVETLKSNLTAYGSKSNLSATCHSMHVYSYTENNVTW